MSKVICDICGTAYPETSAQCPICGCAKVSTAQTAAADASQRSEDTATGYTYVKGGRFSKKNVRKRNKANGRPQERRVAAPARAKEEKEEKTSVALIIIVILLLLAIVAVMIYIGLQFFGSDSKPDSGNNSTVQTDPNIGNNGTKPTDQTDPTEPSGGVPQIPCTNIVVSGTILEFQNTDSSWTLTLQLEPADTTDVPQFASSNPAVAIVSRYGVVTPVGPGEAVITVTCGTIVKECQVVCNFGNNQQPEDKTFDFAFNTKYVDSTTGKYDITLGEYERTHPWKAYRSDMKYDPEQIIWASDDTSVCTIDKGMVTVVGPGTTEIHAQYNGITYTCIVRCNVKAEEKPEEPEDPDEPVTPVEPEEPENPETPENPEDTPAEGGNGGQTSGTYEFKFNTNNQLTDGKYDVSFWLSEGHKSWQPYRNDFPKNPMTDITWTTDNSAVCIIEKGLVMLVGVGVTEIHATYEGVTYTCIIRVNP